MLQSSRMYFLNSTLNLNETEIRFETHSRASLVFQFFTLILGLILNSISAVILKGKLHNYPLTSTRQKCSYIDRTYFYSLSIINIIVTLPYFIRPLQNLMLVLSIDSEICQRLLLRFTCPIGYYIMYCRNFMYAWIITIFCITQNMIIRLKYTDGIQRKIDNLKYETFTGIVTIFLLSIVLYFHFIWMMGVSMGSCQVITEWMYFLSIWRIIDLLISGIIPYILSAIISIANVVIFLRLKLRFSNIDHKVRLNSLIREHTESANSDDNVQNHVENIIYLFTNETVKFILPITVALFQLPSTCLLVLLELCYNTCSFEIPIAALTYSTNLALVGIGINFFIFVLFSQQFRKRIKI